MAEQIAPYIAGDADEGVIGDPGGDAPQQIIGGDQRAEQAERRPHRGIGAARKRIDQEFDAVLRADRTADRAQHRVKNNGMGNRPQPDIAKYEAEGEAA